MKIDYQYVKYCFLYQYQIFNNGVLVRRIAQTGESYQYKFHWGMQVKTNRDNLIEIIGLKPGLKSFVRGFYPLAKHIGDQDKYGKSTDCSLSNQIDILIDQGLVARLPEKFDYYQTIDYATEIEAFIRRRVGQDKFRSRLIEYWGACAVTSCEQFSLLVASHIKPWRDATDEERLDPFNGILLLANLDKAFDAGLISFDDSGKILISSTFKHYLVAGIHPEMKVSFKEGHLPYLAYHRAHIFQQ